MPRIHASLFLFALHLAACGQGATSATTADQPASSSVPGGSSANTRTPAAAGGGGGLALGTAGKGSSNPTAPAVSNNTKAVAGSAGVAETSVSAGAAAPSGLSGVTGAPSAAGSGGAGASAATQGAAGAAGSAAPAQCPATVLAPGETTTTVQVGAASRTFILHVPSGYTGTVAVPLVIDWHSLGSTGAGQEGVSGYKALSDKEGFIVAWPNGIDNAWNIGPCCTTSRSVDDLAFAKAVVENISSRVCIDAKRVYATGYSMGGGMSHHLACNAADVFAAVAPAAFDLLTEDEQPCHPKRPVSVIFFRGTADPLVTYQGGASMPPSGLNVTIHFLGAEGTFKKWAELNGCTDMPTGTGAGCQTYSQCKEGTEVTLCTKQGGSHDPGDANRGWETLKKHPMP